MMPKKVLFGILSATALVGAGTVAASMPAFAATNTATHQQTVEKHHDKEYEPLKEISSILNMDVKTLRADLKSGKSIAQIAQSKGISEQTLISDLQAKLKNRLDQEVANKKITADKESQILSKSSAYFKKLVEHKGLFEEHKDEDHLKEIASILGIDENTLEKDLKAGKSIADVAQSKGISEQTLISDLQTKLKSRLDHEVASGKLTSDKENAILSKFGSQIQKFVEHKGLSEGHEHSQQQQN